MLQIRFPESRADASAVPTPAALQARRFDALCRDALRREAMAWPKPGLVSPVDAGSHADMSIATFLASIAALDGMFAQLALAGAHGCSLAVLQRIGLEAERRMHLATAGVNTHRGAIFNLGLLVAAAARRQADATLAGHSCGAVVARVWGAQIAAGRAHSPVSHGNAVFRRFAVGGARVEAAAGFPTVYGVGVATLRRLLAAGVTEEEALLGTLMALMAELDDTNLLWRGGEAGLTFARERARRFCAEGGVEAPGWQARLVELHGEFVARRLSPGGSADLVAAAWLAHRLEAPDGVPG